MLYAVLLFTLHYTESCIFVESYITRHRGTTKTHLNAHHGFVDERRKINFLHRFLVIFVQIRRKDTHFFPKNNNLQEKTTAKTTFKTTVPLQSGQQVIQKTANREGLRHY